MSDHNDDALKAKEKLDKKRQMYKKIDVIRRREGW